MSIRAFLYSKRAEEARHNDLLLFSSLIMTQTQAHCPSARPLIKPNTLYHLLITSTQQQESRTGQRLLNATSEQSSGRTGINRKHPVYRSGIVHSVTAQGRNNILVQAQTHKDKENWRKEREKKHIHSAKHFTLTINPFGLLIC